MYWLTFINITALWRYGFVINSRFMKCDIYLWIIVLRTLNVINDGIKRIGIPDWIATKINCTRRSISKKTVDMDIIINTQELNGRTQLAFTQSARGYFFGIMITWTFLKKFRLLQFIVLTLAYYCDHHCTTFGFPFGVIWIW